MGIGLGLIAKAASSIMNLGTALLKRKERKAQEETGALREREEHNKESRDAEERMDSVDRPTSDDTADRLRDPDRKF